MVFNRINWNKSILVLLLTVVLHKANGQCTFPGLSVMASNDTVCAGASIALVPGGASSYTLNPGNIVSNFFPLSPTVTTVYSVTATSGTCIATITINITVLPVPNQPIAIAGNTIVVANTFGNYSVSPVPGATSYNWSLPSGWSGSSTTNTISVLTATNNGVISVVAQNSCGVSTPKSLTITVSGCPVPNVPNTIDGNTTANSGSIETYSVLPVVGATSYIWTLPAGYSGASTSNVINITIGTSADYLYVAAQNSCGISVARTIYISINGCPEPNQPSAIMGNTIVAAGSTHTYSVSPAADATSYGWFLPNGYTGSSTTNVITVTIGTVSDFIGVVAQNSCGWSLQPSILPITVSGCAVPNQPGAITGNTTVNSGSIETYSISPVVGATSYVWTLPAGYTGSSTNNSISVTTGATNGAISVVAQNSCGVSAASSIILSVPSSTVVAPVTLCQPYLFKNIESQIFCNINGIMLIGVQYDGLWKSDGTATGTVKINASPQYITGPLVILGNTAYFKSGMQIWKTDGTEAGTVMVLDIPNTSGLGNLVPAGNFVFFLVRVNNTVIYKLWKTDGTAAGTSMVMDIDPTNSISWDPRYLFAYNNTLYFKAGNSTYGMELWKSDGTAAGTVVVKDVNPGSGAGTSSGGSYFAIYNNELYYHGGYTTSGAFSNGLWKTNGTDPGTMLVKTTSYIDNITVIDGLLYFFAFDEGGLTGNSLYGEELWRSDGTTSGTYMVKDTKPGSGSGVSSGSQLANINGKIIFGASDGTTGIELWASDGTAGGTQLLKDIFSGTSGSLGNYFTASDPINGYIYFGADNGTVGRELWATDGSSSGTFLVSDIWQGINGSSPWGFNIFNGNLYYSVYGNFDNSLWSCGNFVGIRTIENDYTLSIYPNPNTGLFQIKSDEQLKEAGIKIYSAQGQTIFESAQFISEIDLSKQPKGIYFLQIKAENKIVNKKIVVQ